MLGLVVRLRPEVHCVEPPCPSWLRGLGATFAMMALLSGGLALLRDGRWGSQLDLDARELVWWHTALGTKRIPLATIVEVRLLDGTDSDRVELVEDNGRVLRVPDECLPPDRRAWVAAVQAELA